MIVTFYSFKGGVGRSMAVANVAEILASRGYRVIICDWDLEAPGLERYFIESQTQNPFKRDPNYEAQLERFESHPGLLDLLLEYKKLLSENDPGTETGDGDAFTHFGELSIRRPSSYAIEVSTRGRGSVRLLTAGRREGTRFDEYAEGVRNFNWREFYDEWAGGAWLDFFRDDLLGAGPSDPARAADIVLVDSRTGVTEHSGVCTHHLADVVVLFSAPNRANLDGTMWMTSALRSQTLRATRTPPKLLPVASRVEIVAERLLLAEFDEAFRQGLAKVAGEAVSDPDSFLKSARVPYVSFYSFQEAVVARETDARNSVLYDAYSALTDAIEDCGTKSGLLLPRQPRPQVSPDLVLGGIEGPVVILYGEGERQTALALSAALKTLNVAVTCDAGDTDIRPAAWLEMWDERVRTSGRVVLVVNKMDLDHRAIEEMRAVLRARLAAPKPIHLIVAVSDAEGSAEIVFPFVNLSGDRHSDAREIVRSLLSDASIIPPLLDPALNPYPGFRPYTSGLSLYFAGRQPEIIEAVRRLTERPSTAASRLIIHAPSHCGKTSMLEAGLLPALRRVTPKALGIVRLSTSDVTTNAEDVREIDLTWPLTIDSEVRRAVAAHKEAGRAIVFVLHWNRNLSNVKHFSDIERILRQALEQNPSAMLIAEVRSIDLDDLSRFLGTVQPPEILLLGPLTPSALRSVVELPVLIEGGRFEDGVVERIVNDALPFAYSAGVISQTMQTLWQRRRANVITHDSYSQIGGIEGVFIAEAESLAQSLEVAELKLFKDLLLVVASRDPHRWEESFADRVDDFPLPENSDAVVNAMSLRGIIQIGPNGAELVEDRAINRWRRFVEYRDLDEQNIRRRRKLENAAGRWRASGRLRWALPSDEELQEFSSVDHKSGLAEEFLQSARRWQMLRRYGRYLLEGLTITALIVLSSILYQRQAKKTQAEALIVQSRRLLTTDPTESLRRALDAAKTWKSAGATEQVLTAAKQSRLLAELAVSKPVASIALPANGSELLVASEAAVALYDLRSGRALLKNTRTAGGIILSAAVTWAGNDVLVIPEGAAPEVWHVGHDAPSNVTSAPMTSGAFSRDGSRFVVASTSITGTVGAMIARTEDPTSVGQKLYKDFQASIGVQTEFSAAGDRIISTGYGGWVTIWNALSRLKLIELRPHGEVVPFLAISDGGTGVTATPGGSVRVWDLTSAELRKGVEMPAGTRGSGVTAIALSPDGSTLLVSNDAEIRRFSTTDANREGTQFRAEGATALAFSPDGEQIAIGKFDGSLAVSTWRNNRTVFSVHAHEGTIRKMIYSADGRRLATSGADRRVRVWDAGLPPEPAGDPIAFGRTRLPMTLGAMAPPRLNE